MISSFEQLKQEALVAISSIKDKVRLEQVRIEFLGRKGKLAALMQQIATLAMEEKKAVGAFANEVKQVLETAFLQKETELHTAEASVLEQSERLDITEPGVWPPLGHLHPVSTAIAEVTDIFSRIGFQRVRAPDVDWDYYAFESLNMPKDHPARDDWETFFVAQEAGSGQQAASSTGDEFSELQAASCKPPDHHGRLVLTPQTSNAQVREMEKGKLPIRMICIGRTYRRQSDVSHTPMFHQFEGLYIDKGVTIAHLKGVLDYFAEQYFGPGRVTRLRPHHFPFTEPSFEIDISCGMCQAGHTSSTCRLCKSGWLELGGAGMVHPNVLKAGGVDARKYTGFAFGWGVERTLCMRSGMNIDDIRILYKNDLRFVKQF